MENYKAKRKAPDENWMHRMECKKFETHGNHKTAILATTQLRVFSAHKNIAIQK